MSKIPYISHLDLKIWWHSNGRSDSQHFQRYDNFRRQQKYHSSSPPAPIFFWIVVHSDLEEWEQLPCREQSETDAHRQGPL